MASRIAGHLQCAAGGGVEGEVVGVQSNRWKLDTEYGTWYVDATWGQR
jgi:hypothetical protein